MPDGEENNEGQGTDAQGTQPPAGGDADKQGAGNNDQGFPENTPWRDMTLAQQVEYWQAQSRKHEGRVKQMGDYDDLKTQAAEYAKLVEASKTDQERAIDAAAKEAREATLKEIGSRLVDAQFTVAGAGRFSADKKENQDRVDALLENLDRSRFMKDDGTADTDKVVAFLDSVAPAQKQQEQHHDFGQGRRQGSTAPSVEAGFELYKQLHPQQTP